MEIATSNLMHAGPFLPIEVFPASPSVSLTARASRAAGRIAHWRERLVPHPSVLSDTDAAEFLDRIRRRLGVPAPPPRPLIRPAATTQVRRSVGRRTMILAATHNLELQGAPMSLLEILAGLVPRFDVHLSSPIVGPLESRADAAGIRVHCLPSPQDAAKDRRSYEKQLSTFAAMVSELGPDLILANSLATFHAVDTGRILGIPSLWAIRESSSPASFFAQFPRSVQARALACVQYPAHFVFVSKDTMTRWPASEIPRTVIHTELEPSRIEAMRGQWQRTDARHALGLAEQDIVVLTIGTLCVDKGQLDLVKAIPQAISREPRLRFVLVGAPAEPGGTQIISAINGLGASRERVLVHPPTSDPSIYYAAADIYLSTSKRESYPRTLLEARAFRLPLVGPAIDGIPELVCGYDDVAMFRGGDVVEMVRSILHAASRTRAPSAPGSSPTPDREAYAGMIERYVQLITSLTQ